jgi:hypothetical protein
MTATQVEIIDCKVEVRKWVLVRNPSRWKQKGQRVIVYSPMLHIPKEVSHVPVKRFSHDEDNSVCFMPKCDIEKNSSKIYERMQVGRAPSFIDAHGIAIANNSPSDGFRYRRGDRFVSYNGCSQRLLNEVPTCLLHSGSTLNIILKSTKIQAPSQS